LVTDVFRIELNSLVWLDYVHRTPSFSISSGAKATPDPNRSASDSALQSAIQLPGRISVLGRASKGDEIEDG